MKVELIAYTPNPEIVVAAAGKTCYSSTEPDTIFDQMTDEAAEKFIDRLGQSGHVSPLEHASFTFAVTGVSRSLLAQLTRHRIASFSVASQRYIKGDRFGYVVPEEIAEDPHAKRIFEDAMDEAARAYHDIHCYLMSARLRKKYADAVTHSGLNAAFANNIKHFYLALNTQMESMIKNDPTHENQELYKQYKKDRSAAEKFANENARAVLPNATETNLVFTMNARELLHFFGLRCCNRAQDEIRHMADLMLAQCKQVAPNIFKAAGPGCVRGACPEGKMTCGSPRVDLKGD